MEQVIEKVITKDQLKEEMTVKGPFTICVIEGPNGVRGYGLAVKSKFDKYNGEMGQKIAHGRAMKAIVKKLNGEPLRHSYMG